MTRVGLIAVLVLGCLGPQVGPRSGGTSAPTPDFTEPSARAVGDGGIAGFGPSLPIDGPPAMDSPQCFKTTALPPGCEPGGEWRLTHGQPEGDCPFGASQHVITLFAGGGYLCLQPVDDFQLLQAGAPGTCAVELTGMHVVTAAVEPYTETWTSRLTFAAGGGTGETQVSVSGGHNCVRKFQTTIDRK